MLIDLNNGDTAWTHRERRAKSTQADSQVHCDLHMHRDVVVYSSDEDELAAALLFRHERDPSL